MSLTRTPLLAPARSDPATHQGTRRVLRERAVLHVGAGTRITHAIYDDVNYSKWVLGTIDDKSSREMRALKQLMVEISEHEGIHDKIFRLVNASCIMPPLLHEPLQQGLATWLSRHTSLGPMP